MRITYPYKNEDELVDQAKELTAQYVREGWGSRASVLHAVYDLFETDIPLHYFVRFSSILDPLHGPAGAIHFPDGRRAGVVNCGALTSGLLAFSMIHGDRELPFRLWADAKPDHWLGKIFADPGVSTTEKVKVFDTELEKTGYGAYQHIALRFYEHFGTTDCYDLQKPFGNPTSSECFRNCARVIIWTAGMVTEIILAYAKEPSSFKLIDDNVNSAILRSVAAYSKNQADG